MATKTIMLCDGPASGTQLAVLEDVHIYKCKVKFTEPLSNEMTIQEVEYYKSTYKFGEFELFICKPPNP